MKKLPLVLITWQDAHAGGGGWLSIEKVSAQQSLPHLCYTVGWVIHRDRYSLIVAQNRSYDGDVSDTMTIPLGCIRKTERLQ